jgi:hypothetical protein
VAFKRFQFSTVAIGDEAVREMELNQYFFTDYDIVHMRSRVRSPGKGNPNHRTASP